MKSFDQLSKEELLKLQRKYETPSGFGSSPYFSPDYFIHITKAKNGIIYENDKQYIDFSSFYGVESFGHQNSFVKKRVKKQMDLFWNASDFPSAPRAMALSSIIRLMKTSNLDNLDKVIFSSSGAEAVEAAAKLSLNKDKNEFVAFRGSYHGCQTLGSLSFTSGSMKIGFPQTLTTHFMPYAYCYRCEFGLEYPKCDMKCIEFLDDLLANPGNPPYKENIAAIILEPLQGEGGYVIPPKEFIKGIRRICDIYGILLIDDEVQSGMCRSGKIWAINHYGVKPDILISAKALGGGYPGAAMTVANHSLFGSAWQKPGTHSSTWDGNPLACTAIDATIELVLKNKLWQVASKKGDYIKKWLSDIREDCEVAGDCNNIGCFGRIELVRDGKKPATLEAFGAMKEALKKGLFLQLAGPFVNVIRVAPPITLEYTLIDKGFEILLNVLKKAEELKLNPEEFQDIGKEA